MSMTGYGRGVCKLGDLEVTAEIRSVNNRFLDVVVKLPKTLSDYEQKIRELVGQHLSRGRVNLWLSITSGDDRYQSLNLNKGLAAAYVRLAKSLRDELNIKGELEISQLLSFPDIIVADADEAATEETWKCAQEAINQALEQLSDMRLQEGKALQQDFVNRINHLEELITRIEEIAANSPQEELDKLRNRVARLIKDEQVDENRLELELALIADRLDVTEECVRFHSHNQLFLDVLDSEKASGRKLNFLLQEMNREANTIGSKAASSDISHLVVEIKEEVERIREQVQNVE